ncbi:MAG: crotonase/enoyl-CoA hydratase family protein [Limibacillus sp.]|jgi:DSF synthase
MLKPKTTTLKAAAPQAEISNDWPKVIGWLQKSRSYKALEVDMDVDSGVLWTMMRHHGVPCVEETFLSEGRQLQDMVRHTYLRAEPSVIPFKYMVFGSTTPGIFSLGGNLRLFVQLIREGRRGDLLSYATNCVDLVYNNAMCNGLPVMTISLVQGDALGGGFEAAISSNYVIAERSAKFGLPEVLFNLFPGMGAYSLIARRVDTVVAERMILSGKIYTAEELYEVGLVDMLVEDGEGKSAVMDFAARNARRHAANLAIYRARHRVNPLSYEELYDTTVDWVDTALTLGEEDLRKMERLALMQERRAARPLEG